MNSRLNGDMLVTARDEYRHQLYEQLKPLIMEGFSSIYSDSVRMANSKEYNGNSLKSFQVCLKNIPRWSNIIIEQETERVMNKCPFLMNLVTALFVTNVKILACVRLGGDHRNIRVKIPTKDVFLHKIYNNCAEVFYYDPQKFQQTNDIKKYVQNLEDIHSTIRDSIDKVIRELLPIERILDEYLGDTFETLKGDDMISCNSVSDDESVESLLEDGDAEEELEEELEEIEEEDDEESPVVNFGQQSSIPLPVPAPYQAPVPAMIPVSDQDMVPVSDLAIEPATDISPAAAPSKKAFFGDIQSESESDSE